MSYQTAQGKDQLGGSGKYQRRAAAPVRAWIIKLQRRGEREREDVCRIGTGHQVLFNSKNGTWVHQLHP